MNRSYDWQFPLPRTHPGMLLGTGTPGVLVGGAANLLRLTLGRADFWDHRGGMPWREGMSYRNIRHHLDAGDEPGLRALFERTDPAPGEPHRPTVLPIGRVELALPEGTTLESGTLDLDAGRITVRALSEGGADLTLGLDLSMQSPVLHVDLPPGMSTRCIRRIPAWEYVGDYLESISFAQPALFDGAGLSGWVQERPADPPLCLAYRLEGSDLWLTAVYGADPADARGQAGSLIAAFVGRGSEALREETQAWWRDYWREVPELDLPNPLLAFLYDYGMYKFAGLTNPTGVAATLQGPWIEEYQMPPWSSDYHFNINVQMCYWPAYRGNRLSHLPPIFALLTSWRERLRENARIFVGIEDGLMLPHAVDDRGMRMGGFWTGSMDHGCTAWMADLMYQYYRYTGDVAFLRETAYPFMYGAMRVCEEMLED